MLPYNSHKRHWTGTKSTRQRISQTKRHHRSGRHYKNDFSDIVGILADHEQRGTPISLNAIHAAILNLYGSLDTISPASRKFIEDIINQGDFKKIYTLISQEEKLSKDILIHFQETYPHAVTTSNADAILKALKDRKNQ